MENTRKRIKLIRKIWPYIEKYNLQWILLFALKIMQIVPALLYPLVFKMFINEVLLEYNLDGMYKLIVSYIAVYLLETALKAAHRYYDNNLFNKITTEMRLKIWNIYMYMPSSILKTYEISDLKNRVDRDIDLFKYVIIWQVFDYITNFIFLISSALILLWLDWRIAVICYILIPVSAFISHRYKYKIGRLYEKQRLTDDETEKKVLVSISNWKEIKASNLEKKHQELFNRQLDRQYDLHKETKNTLKKNTILLNTKDSLLNPLLVYLVGGILYYANLIEISVIIVSIQYYNKMVLALTTLLNLDYSLEELNPSVHRVIDLLSNHNYKKIGDYPPFERDEGIIYKVHGLTYTYPDNHKNLDYKDFTIQKGAKILLYGKSGSGKSTLAKILLGELSPANGTILFHGVDITLLNHQHLYREISYVPQEPYFMDVSIKEYLMMGPDPHQVTPEKIKEACQKTNLYDFVRQLPDGLDTRIGRNGIALSGGQKQRLALARVFLMSKKVLILDEAFSAIDGSERIPILEKLFEHFKNGTIICISHEPGISDYFSCKINIG